MSWTQDMQSHTRAHIKSDAITIN